MPARHGTNVWRSVHVHLTQLMRNSKLNLNYVLLFLLITSITFNFISYFIIKSSKTLENNSGLFRKEYIDENIEDEFKSEDIRNEPNLNRHRRRRKRVLNGTEAFDASQISESPFTTPIIPLTYKLENIENLDMLNISKVETDENGAMVIFMNNKRFRLDQNLKELSEILEAPIINRNAAITSLPTLTTKSEIASILNSTNKTDLSSTTFSSSLSEVNLNSTTTFEYTTSNSQTESQILNNIQVTLISLENLSTQANFNSTTNPSLNMTNNNANSTLLNLSLKNQTESLLLNNTQLIFANLENSSTVSANLSSATSNNSNFFQLNNKNGEVILIFNNQKFKFNGNFKLFEENQADTTTIIPTTTTTTTTTTATSSSSSEQSTILKLSSEMSSTLSEANSSSPTFTSNNYTFTFVIFSSLNTTENISIVNNSTQVQITNASTLFDSTLPASFFQLSNSANYTTLIANLNSTTLNAATSLNNFPLVESNTSWSNGTKYVLYECLNLESECGGWGDRVKGILSAYAVALITKRRLVINMTYPCSLVNFLQPNEVDWNVELPDSLKRFYLVIKWNKLFVKTILPKINFLELENNTDVIVIKSGLQFIKYLSLNPSHHERIKELGYRLDEFALEFVFEKWYKQLFKFKSSLEKKYQRLLSRAKPTPNHQLICAQLRLGGRRPDPQFNDGFFTYRYNSRKFWEFIRDNFLSKSNLTEYKIFVTTDTSEVVDEAIQEFGYERVVGTRDKSIHLDKHQDLDRDECPTLSYLFIDFFFLGHCDMGVISHSGFGLLGLLNRPDRNFADFYVYTSPEIAGKNFWKRAKYELGFYNYNFTFYNY